MGRNRSNKELGIWGALLAIVYFPIAVILDLTKKYK